jgi:carbonic anhydrase
MPAHLNQTNVLLRVQRRWGLVAILEEVQMFTRRDFLATSGLIAAGATLARAEDLCAVPTSDTQAATTADQALQRLKDGNARFVFGRTINCNLMMQVKATAHSQAPLAAILGCMDSRVAPELVFDQRIGDIFSIRVAANVVNTDVLGSMEYATEEAKTKLIVVLGHSECGGIKGAVDDVHLGNLTSLLSKIRPAVEKVSGAAGDRTSKNKQLVQSVADQNALNSVAALTSGSEVLASLVKEQKLKIVAAMHDVGTGTVRWLT